jgi:hypothetical protein
MIIMCQVATRIASLRLSMQRNSKSPATIAGIATINLVPLAN